MDQKQLLDNLLQLYLYEFTDYTDDDLNSLGRYDYEYFESYFIDKDRYAYFIYMGTQLVGFCMVNQHSLLQNSYIHSIAEFFILRKYRKYGIGRAAANEVLAKHGPSWEIPQLTQNKIAMKFWEKVILEISNGNYQIILSSTKDKQTIKFEMV